jgi:hypothetical protein
VNTVYAESINVIAERGTFSLYVRVIFVIKFRILEIWNKVTIQRNGRALFKLLCPQVLSSIPDRVPEMDENWTFDTCSSLCTKKGA